MQIVIEKNEPQRMQPLNLMTLFFFLFTLILNLHLPMNLLTKE